METDVFTILAFSFGAVSLVAMGVLPFAFSADRTLARDGIVTTGKVLAIENDSETGWNAKIEIITPVGRFESFAATKEGLHTPGQAVRVRYLPSSPKEAVLDEPRAVYRRTVLAVILSGGFAFASAAFFVLRTLM